GADQASVGIAERERGDDRGNGEAVNLHVHGVEDPAPGARPECALLAWLELRIPFGRMMCVRGNLHRHCRLPSRGAPPRRRLKTFVSRRDVQNSASCVFFRSVTSMRPGECVIAKGGFAAAIAACGVTPQAQNTGNSSAST